MTKEIALYNFAAVSVCYKCKSWFQTHIARHTITNIMHINKQFTTILGDVLLCVTITYMC